jgi:hypothetical protein
MIWFVLLEVMSHVQVALFGYGFNAMTPEITPLDDAAAHEQVLVPQQVTAALQVPADTCVDLATNNRKKIVFLNII